MKREVVIEDLREMCEAELPWGELDGKTVLVTGATGMLASYVTWLLLHLHEREGIHVSVVADEHQIVCEISNTYYPKTSKDQSGHGIGLQQVTRRLDLLYPDLYTWERGPSADGKYYQSKLIIHDTKLHHH